MTVREAVLKAIEKLADDDLEGGLEYIQFAKEPPEVEVMEEELNVIARGCKEYARGEFVAWEDVKSAQA